VFVSPTISTTLSSVTATVLSTVLRTSYPPRGHQSGTKRKSGAPGVSEAPDSNGGPSRTRTLDPLIKSLSTAAREIEHFPCRCRVHSTLHTTLSHCMRRTRLQQSQQSCSVQPTNQPTTPVRHFGGPTAYAPAALRGVGGRGVTSRGVGWWSSCPAEQL